jgi:hypothetical protein
VGSVTHRRQLEDDGYVVLRGVVDGAALAAEMEEAMTAAFAQAEHANVGSAGTTFRYLPMMSSRTPVSLAATVALAARAAELLDAPVLPGRTKATRYLSGTGWHRDSSAPLRSIGFLCYLDALDGDSGALQVVPGSHRPSSAGSADVATDDGGASSDEPDARDVLVLPTAPGDAIVLDEHLLHASTGGGRWRRQWRVDFVADACGGGGDAALRALYAGLHAPGWDGGYDVDRFPSYGPAWRQLDARWTRRLDELGAFAAAAAEEEAARERRAGRGA